MAKRSPWGILLVFSEIFHNNQADSQSGISLIECGGIPVADRRELPGGAAKPSLGLVGVAKRGRPSDSEPGRERLLLSLLRREEARPSSGVGSWVSGEREHRRFLSSKKTEKQSKKLHFSVGQDSDLRSPSLVFACLFLDELLLPDAFRSFY